ncbi:MAG: metalloregulator ArsR/SmtB family transcription factor [Phenylobacterium sp.]|jgi:ubiquinone/menaquinone biosynthesis C-methylase UbiE/DNA-binding transcriptional ArsR family regulator|uniref:Metalloregulator ArsR/SmtB family transcription factor n=1 Tax=Phenylobacterium ferrooxidans TaxID=2982689 RepID=A0ABW6CS22_9CAUL|nr:metalloregulator ArsR/SmtB family transcription factor [Phenylobacterium sp.]MDO8323618.1 metalloregulator ArsR/SmtB family transcription factor [Phenylobacterium sp.]MDO8912650.1 metalloregulator ArsR/SmtB family transcription factor [Phenylobacterium sp.]MDP3101916.1 metalloregulator ArsR/SmtB family transcription factor [Phenylobacterium sp.]MDP3867037.1 metalloregulator ArsR/SmtB family transcription factor [Phenylobacterium sp.]
MSLSAIQAVEVLRAAGEPTRLRILALLSHEELAVLELCKVLDQSQPRVSRHLKLLAEAGLVERFPDGAWVFYRLVAGGLARRLADETLAVVDLADPILARDAERLQAVRAERSTEAGEYFARNAARWDEIRSLYVSETDVEAAVLEAAGPGPFKRLVDLGSGTGRMLTLLGPHAQAAVGLDLSQQMLNIARRHVADAGLERCELRHGDIFGTRLPGQSADLVVVHQVLHYLGDPAAAVREAARLVAEDGRLIIVDFAPHSLEFLREQHQHRRLGFAEAEMERWLNEAGLTKVRAAALPPARGEGLTVKIWTAERVRKAVRSAA